MSRAELDEYVEENRDNLHDVVFHSDDTFAQACALALLKRGGGDPELERIEKAVEERKDA